MLQPDNLRLGSGQWGMGNTNSYSCPWLPCFSPTPLMTTDIEMVNLCEFSLWVVLGSLVFI
jgi:hypothetical protein